MVDDNELIKSNKEHRMEYGQIAYVRSHWFWRFWDGSYPQIYLQKLRFLFKIKGSFKHITKEL